MLIDKRTGQMVIRVVYDGAPQAGKTTNLQNLTAGISLQRRGALVSPGTTSRRTEFFDWLTFTGGFVDGRRLKCQLVSVPGQPSLLRRRRYLLDSADVVVFVADSRPHAVREGRLAFTLLREVLAHRAGPIPASVVLQANKQDLADSLPPAALGEALGVPDEIPVIGAQSMTGEGVMQTFITAVRLGTSRVEAILRTEALDGQLTPLEVSPEELLAALRRSEEGLLAQEIEASRRLVVVPRPAPSRLDGPVPESELPAPVPGSERPTPVPPSRQQHTPEPPPRLLAGGELSMGHVWPLVEGRTILAELAGGRAEWSRRPAPWMPGAWNEARIDDGFRTRWLVHTRPEWHYTSSEPAKMGLITLVRRLRDLEPWLPPGRALSLHSEGDGMRLWMVTDALPSLRTVLSGAREDTTARAIDAVEDALRAAAALGHVRVGTPALDAIGVDDGRAYVMPPPEESGEPLSSLPGALEELLEALPGRERPDADALLEDRTLGSRMREALRRWLGRPAG